MRSKSFLLIVHLLYTASLTQGCVHQTRNTKATAIPHRDTIVKGNFSPISKLQLDTASIAGFISTHPEFKSFSDEFSKFYRINGYHYVWYDGKRLNESASNLLNHINMQNDDGVLLDIPCKNELNKLVDSVQTGLSVNQTSVMELLLTGQYFNYAKNVWGGAEAEKTDRIGWYLPRKKLSYAELLEKSLRSSGDSVEQTSVIPQYISLKRALNRYQAIEKNERDILVPQQGNDLYTQDDTSAFIIRLKGRLRQLGDLADSPSSKRSDTVLAGAVRRFKERHGLTVNDRLDRAFFHELNVPLNTRIEQMIVNLERMRWIPADDHGGEFLLVNIPEYRLHYFVNNQPNWACNVVVGDVMTKTVIFSGYLQYIVFSPYWYVPQSIIQKEIKPGISRDPDYLAKHHMEWNGGNVRQKPGLNNSLGLVKFMFPNSNNIYLHDSPAKSLFHEDMRAFSHGCIRVSEPEELANRILNRNPLWTSEKIHQAMYAGKEKAVPLGKKIPVYIGYFTAFVNSKGVLNFREDVYNRDAALLSMLLQAHK